MSVCVQEHEATKVMLKDIRTGKKKDFGHLGRVTEMTSHPDYKRLS